MKNYNKIIERLKASQALFNRAPKDVCLNSAYKEGREYDELVQEYSRAWDAAGVIWDAACEAEVEGDTKKAKKLWALLAPFDDEAASRLEGLL